VSEGAGTDLADDLARTLAVVDAADELSTSHFEGLAGLAVETKPDLSPVTEADRSVERLVRERLAAENPGDAVVGEEYGTDDGPGGGTGRRWIVDPIDGTQNFIRGVPVWATLLALEIDGEGALGVVSAPALGMRWWATRGAGAFRNGRRIRVSEVSDPADAYVAYDSIPEMERFGLGDAHLDLVRRAHRSRGFGDFWSHVLVAQGACDIAVEPRVNHWDWAPLRVIVEEAGGRATDLDGSPLHGKSGILTSNGRLHREAVAVYSGHGAARTDPGA